MCRNILKAIPPLVLLFITISCRVYPPPAIPSEVHTIDSPSGVYYPGYWPDGKICTVKKGDTWQLFWCEAVDILTEGPTVWPEDHYSKVTKNNIVFGKETAVIPNFTDHGAWFIGVFPLNDSGRYVGFFHAETYWPDEVSKVGEERAHKSIGVTYSNDYGKTWEKGTPIITSSSPKPAHSSWSGLGDGTVIYDEVNSRWICYYQGKAGFGSNKLCMAASYDPEGKPGTWKKWDGSDFSGEACGENGLGSSNVAISNLSDVPGANPSVMWNHYLNKWIMVYHSWEKEIYLAASDDAIHWTNPKKIIGDKDFPVWYPNLISEEGEKTGGQTVRLYFGYFYPNPYEKRHLSYCDLSF
ncbi:MAG: hypothetical protein MJ160_05540 [Treponema sp.]|nr:hypothetical protein [Treponema sp.]